MTSIDLTPFGFTPTESSAYGALLQAGPSSGYAVAKRLSIARANAYQALHGLVSKRAAELSGEEPRVFRAVQPSALLARVARETAGRLDALEAQVNAIAGGGAPDTVPFNGDAEFESLLLRMAVRDESPLTAIAPPEELLQNLPIWRTRLANDRPTELLSLGQPPEEFPVPIARVLDPLVARTMLGTSLTIVITETTAILCGREDGKARGFWTSDPILVACARGSVLALRDQPST